MTLDLLAGPARRLDGALGEVTVRPSVLDHRADPFLSEGFDKLPVGVSVCKVTVIFISLHVQQCTEVQADLPNNTHRRPHKSLTPVHVAGNDIEQLEDGLDVRLQNLSLVALLHGANDTAPGIHNALPE